MKKWNNLMMMDNVMINTLRIYIREFKFGFGYLIIQGST